MFEKRRQEVWQPHHVLTHKMCVKLLSDGSKPEPLIQCGLLENECGKMLHTASETNLV